MKKVLLTSLIVFLITLCAQAQVERGKYLVGGNADMSTSYQGKNSGFNLSLSPSFGIFVVKGFALGARYSFGISSSKTFSNTRQEYVVVTTFNSGIGPLVRYYFGKK